MSDTPSKERLKELLHYDPGTGDFTRLVRTSNSVKIGDIAGGLDADGYRYIRVEGKKYRAHRLAWLWMTGAWPIDQLDHRNGVRDDNRWDNLRESSQVENMQNIAMPNTNTSGFMGVCWSRKAGKWGATIRIAGRSKYLGLYATPDAAHAAYLAAKAEHHPFQPYLRMSK